MMTCLIVLGCHRNSGISLSIHNLPLTGASLAGHSLFDSLAEDRRPKGLFSRSLNRLSSLVNFSVWIDHLIKRM